MDLEALTLLRSEAERRLLSKKNVLGLMIGSKQTGGAVSSEIVLTAVVGHKVPLADLTRIDRIPRRLSIRKQNVKTDVIEIKGWVNQSSTFPLGGALSTYDGVEYGTMSAFGRSEAGIFGVTCAHAVEGRDRNPDTPDPVSIWS